MKHLLKILILFVIGIFIFSPSLFADNNWTIYASYQNPTKAVKMDGITYVLANGDLYSYNEEDSYISTYDKSNVLSDCDIYDIAYCAATRSLVILYSNGNIDVMYKDGQCTNMSELKTSVQTSLTINQLSLSGKEAFIATSTGLVVVNLSDCYFENTYTFTSTVQSCMANSKYIYAITASGTYFGDRTLNLLNPNNWKLMSDTELAADTRYKTLTNENVNDETALAQAKKNYPNSPIRNYSYKLNMIGSRLLVTGGDFFYPSKYPTGTIMKYEDDKWSAFDEEAPLALVGSSAYVNVTDVVQDPNDTEHHWVGSARSGIYEFKDYKLVKHYTYNNSELTSILPSDTHADWYVRVTALNFDKYGNLWMCNNETDTIVKILKSDGTWVKYYYSEIAMKQTFDNTYFDSRGWAWINCRRSTAARGASGLLIVNTNGTIDSQKDDKYRYLSTFANEDGTSYTPDLWYCAVEDLNGTMWVGNTAGIFRSTTPENVFDTQNFRFEQVKVPRNDGSGLADYLLSNVSVKCIAIDGANRKWVGTINNGVYLISADGLTEIYHFTKDDSPLLSDAINDIAINGETGEVFIATDKGLCSYKGDATDPSETLEKSSLKVFPNPVAPNYSGNVHITGLAFNTDVKIANAAGKLVYEGTSNGGRFDWNCCYATGKHVSSGVYYALCTDEEGKKGAVAKILIVAP